MISLLPDDILIIISTLLSLKEYTIFLVIDKYTCRLYRSEICLQYLFKKRWKWLETIPEWQQFAQKFGSWNVLRQGYYSRCLAETACNNVLSGPKMKFAWGPTCGNYWKKIASNNINNHQESKVIEHSPVCLALQQYLFWFSFTAFTTIQIEHYYKIVLQYKFLDNTRLTPLTFTIYQNDLESILYLGHWNLAHQLKKERIKGWQEIDIVHNIFLPVGNIGIRVENKEESFKKGYVINSISLYPVF